MTKQRRRNILLVLLLIIIAIICFFLLRKKEQKILLPAFTLQGETRIGTGDLQLKVWDNNAEDGDTVSIYLDGKLIKDSLGILNEPVVLKVGNLPKGDHLLGIKAINEGSVSPASASMGISNGKEETQFEMNAWVDSAASWKIIIQ